MKYTSLIDNITAKKWGISIPEAYLFDWLYSLPSWAEKAVIGGQDYFFASKNKAIIELPLITDKIDTMYRYYRALEEKGLILLKKVEGRDYISLTPKAKQWNRKSEYSEKNPDSDLNPTELGKKSENDSEKNPTYKITSNNKITNDRAAPSIEIRKELFKATIAPFVSKYGREICNDFYSYWTEISEGQKKMRFEDEKKWEIAKRISRWNKKELQFNKNNGNQAPQEIKASLPKNYRPA